MNRKRLVFLIKLICSVGIIAVIYSKVLGGEGGPEMLARLRQLSPSWLVAAVIAQLCAICCSLLRWERLLIGQGLHAPRRHLLGSFMIGRFFGAFTPGGWTGLNGYRLYDIAVHTGKTARSAAVIGIEMVLGQLSFGAVVIIGSLFGVEVIGLQGVLLIDALFIVLVTGAIVLLSRPTLFRRLGALAPAMVRGRIQTTIDSICAYQGKGRLVFEAALLGMGTHGFHTILYVCTARALGVDLGVGQVFFVTAMQIFSTLMPASLNGIGIREATAVALYTAVGVPAGVALLIPTVGFAVEMFISAFGGLVFLARRVGYKVEIRVDDPDREQLAEQHIERASQEFWPKLSRGAVVGFGGGLLGGILLGVAEAIVVLASASGQKEYSVLAYGGAVYGLACAGIGLVAGTVLALSGRLMHRHAVPEPRAFARYAALIACAGGFAITAFRVRRDVFHEHLVWKSSQGAMVAVGCAVGALIAYFLLSSLLRFIVAHRPFSVLLRAWSMPLVLVLLLAGNAIVSGDPAEAAPIKRGASDKPPAPALAGNVLFLVIDTLRADHLPLWGYDAIETPHLDAFAKDAIRFQHAYANASWTRPSFASLMTGRYASSHRTMQKADSLPSEITTLAEAMQSNGYTTYGLVTNYNVAPFFNFQQGFDEYRYLEPSFVLGAGDTAAKLLFVQALRQGIETYRAKRGQVEPGSAYQDATVVNNTFLKFLDRKPKTPWHAFVAYMDPHDPYFPHPYDGTGYARAANQKPKPEEAPELIKLYDGEIVFWDQEFGKLVAELKRRGLYDSLTIVITSDHGEEFMDHGGYWHGTTLYDEQLHIPLLLKLPRNERGGTVATQWVESIDVMPTLLARNGIEIPSGVQGTDLMIGNDTSFAEEDHEGNVLRSLRMRRGQSELKLIEANESNPRGLQPLELYRVDQDPREMVDMSKQDAPLLGLAASKLDERGRQARVGRAAQQSVNVAADASAVQKLRALGYAGGEDDKQEKKPE